MENIKLRESVSPHIMQKSLFSLVYINLMIKEAVLKNEPIDEEKIKEESDAVFLKNKISGDCDTENLIDDATSFIEEQLKEISWTFEPQKNYADSLAQCMKKCSYMQLLYLSTDAIKDKSMKEYLLATLVAIGGSVIAESYYILGSTPDSKKNPGAEAMRKKSKERDRELAGVIEKYGVSGSLGTFFKGQKEKKDAFLKEAALATIAPGDKESLHEESMNKKLRKLLKAKAPVLR